MPAKNALASIRLRSVQLGGGKFHVSIEVWSHSYDHPDPNHRNAIVNGVYLVQLPQSTNFAVANLKITDRYGIDETSLWTLALGGTSAGFDGYAERIGGGPPSGGWASYTGVYDERCLADPLCDARRLQTYRTGPTNSTIAVFNYLLGPVTFAFDISLSAAPTAVKLKMGHVGGNGGNPAQRSASLPSEEFVFQFP